MSFLTITLAFAATRALLAVQYLVVVISGRRVKRRMSAPAAVLGLAMSCAFAVVARRSERVFAPQSAHQGHPILHRRRYRHHHRPMAVQRLGPVPAVEIARRYGAFSLIIMYVESLGQS
jgi:hypothetical protein